MTAEDAAAPVILFGACDRHNFGDLLFPHIAAALLPPEQKCIVAGLAVRDLSAQGGHRVAALADLSIRWGAHPVTVLHVGGELLTCTAWQAAVMLQSPGVAQEAIARHERRPETRSAWARQQLGIDDLAPYAVARSRFPRAARIAYQAVGGVDLDGCAPELRAEVLAKLAAADAVSVRDRRTLALLEAAGIRAVLAPDPVARVAELFGARIAQRQAGRAVAAVRRAFPAGYLAVQFSADFGDDATLAATAAQLDRVAAETGWGIAFFRAGAAPWHDDDDCYRWVIARMRAGTARRFDSLDIWDICALIAASRGYCGSSLHGRIVAMAYALPRINLVHPAQAGRPTKQAAYAETWENAGMPGVVAVGELAAACLQATGN